MNDAAFDRVVQLAGQLLDVERGTSYGTPALKIKGKAFCRMKENMVGVLVVMVPLGLKEALIEAAPHRYFQTSHYEGWPAMLVNLDEITDVELADRLECAWFEKAPKRLATQYRERSARPGLNEEPEA